MPAQVSSAPVLERPPAVRAAGGSDSPAAPTAGGPSWRRTALTLLVGAVLGAGATAAVFLAVAYRAAGGVPDFYDEALSETPPADRRAAADAFDRKTVELARAAEYQKEWAEAFTQAQINGWLAERLPEEYGDRIPPDVSDPRVDLSKPGLVRLGFKLKNARFDGVVSLAVRPEVTGPNTVALEVEGLWAGLFPLDVNAFRPQVSRALARHGVDHAWADEGDHRDGGGGERKGGHKEDAPGNPVLTVRVRPDGPGRPVLEALEIADGTVHIAGRRGPAVRLTKR